MLTALTASGATAATPPGFSSAPILPAPSSPAALGEVAGDRAWLGRPHGARRELLERRTAYSETWESASGQRVTRVSSTPLRWRASSGGRWRPFDLRLHRDARAAGSRFVPGASPITTTLPTLLDGSDTGATLVSTGNDWIRAWIDGAKASAVTSGAGAMYADALPDVDVELEARPDGLKETLVLRSRSAGTSFSYRLRLADGLEPTLDRKSGAVLVRRGRRVVLVIPEPTIADSAPTASSGPTPSYALSRGTDGTWRLTVTANRKWLASKKRVWPVRLDPSTTANVPANTSCNDLGWYYGDGPPIWGGDGATWTVCTGQTANVMGGLGPWGWTQKDIRLKFPSLSPYLATDDVIDTATLNLFQTAGATGSKLMASALTAAWTPGTKLPNATPQWLTDATYNPSAPPTVHTLAPSKNAYATTAGTGTWTSFNIINMVDAWNQNLGNATKGYPNNGIRVLADAKIYDGFWCFFHSSNTDCANSPEATFATVDYTTDTTKRPYLEIKSWPSAPTGAKLLAPAEGQITGRRVELQAEAANSTVTTARFQYVAGEDRNWRDIPTAALTYVGGTTTAHPSSVNIPLTANRTPKLVWDLHATTGGQIDGSIHVRAVLDDPSFIGSGATVPINFLLDRRNAEKGARERLGPGSVNLVTGDFAMTEQDVSLDAFLGPVGVSRTFHSRGTSTKASEMFGPHWSASFEGDGGSMPYAGLYNYSEIKTEEVERWVEQPVSYLWETQLDLGDDSEPDPYTIYGTFTTKQWTPVVDTLRWEYRYMKITTTKGGQITFTQVLDSSGNVTSNWSPDDEHPGYAITAPGSNWILTDTDGNQITFAPDEPGSPRYHPTVFKQPGSAQTPTFTWATVGGSLRLTKVTAPKPGSDMRDDRSLEFIWTNNASTGGQWRVTTINAWRWDREHGFYGVYDAATYQYDTGGRLVAATTRSSGGMTVTYAYDSSGRLTTITPPGEAAWSLGYTTLPGDGGTGRLASVTRARPAGGGNATWSLAYNVPVSGTGAPKNMTPATMAQWSQVDNLPTDATAVFPPSQIPCANSSSPCTSVVTNWSATVPTAYNKATLHYLDVRGQEVNVADPGGAISMTQHDANGNVVAELTGANRARALAVSDTVAKAQSLMTVHHFRPNGVDEDWRLSPTHAIKLKEAPATVVQGRTKTTWRYDAAPDSQWTSSTTDYHLVTETTQHAIYNDTVKDLQTTQYSYSQPSSSTRPQRGWELRKPLKVTTNPGGPDEQVSTYQYDDNLPLLIDHSQPGSLGMRYSYYGLGAGQACPALVPHEGLAGQICSQQQRLDAGAPAAPLVSYEYTYNSDWNLIEQRVRGGTAPDQTTTITYDSHGRQTGRSVTGAAANQPAATMAYSATTGRMTTTTMAAQTPEPSRTITRAYDNNGRLSTYTDANGAQTTYTYNQDGLMTGQSDSKGTTTYGYNDRGLMTSLTDTAIGATAVTATYDGDGQLLTETMPNGLVMTMIYDETGRPTSRTYTKSSCGAPCTFQDQVTVDAHGRWVTETSTGRSRTFGYDGAGRLSKVEDTVGTTCTTQTYTYNAAGDRTARKTYPAGSGGICSTTTTPTTQTMTVDSADRLTTSGVTYDATLRNITAVPSSLIGAGLTATYYDDDRPLTLTQSGITRNYLYDPLRLIMTRTSSGGATGTEIRHYRDDE
ncbi:MAG: DUF6531 domain-containing protein, partial [Solirubrobacterales bacterium]